MDIPGLALYVAAEHLVVGLTRSAALEGAARGIRVNALVTGNVDTPLYRDLIGANRRTRYLPGTAHGRDMPLIATPGEYRVCTWFYPRRPADEAAFITGAALAIDGGATAERHLRLAPPP